MPDARQLAHEFLDALKANEAQRYEAILCDDAGMIIGGWDGGEAYRPRARVIQRLMEEWSAWPDPTLESFTFIAEGDHAAIEFRIQATEHRRYVEHERSAFLTIKDGKIHTINIYCAGPLPSARRKGWIAPATLTHDELERLFESLHQSGDIREWLPPLMSGKRSLRGFMGGSGDAHPGSNTVAGVRWSAEEADRRIEETIEYHRQRNIGFQWFVGPFDTPPDLGKRLERHGLILAGDQSMMAKLGLDNLDDIPVNPDISIELLDGSDEAAIDAIAHITMVCFNWTQEQIDERRPGWVERMKSPIFREKEATYLARLNGTPVAYGRVMMQGGIAYLGGAGTLPEYRGHKIYSTLLRRRLEEAHVRGYNVAAIDAEPMSKRIVVRYGFNEFAQQYLYAWMPVIDLDVIRSLVPQD